MSKKIYLIDASSLITPKDSYYSFYRAEKFWNEMADLICDGTVLVIDHLLPFQPQQICLLFS